MLSFFLKQRSCPLTPTWFMSDDAQQYWNSWKEAYGENNTKKLLCTWHIDRAWRNALQEHIQGKESQAIVYNRLRVLLSETDSSKFCCLLQQFLSCIYSDHSSFFTYFRSTYATRPVQWATYYRVGTIYSKHKINMHLESFHGVLKWYIYTVNKTVI